MVGITILLIPNLGEEVSCALPERGYRLGDVQCPALEVLPAVLRLLSC